MASFLPLLLQPREVEALEGAAVASLTASKSHSAAVLASGEVLTWGEGKEGKLGHGCTGRSRASWEQEGEGRAAHAAVDQKCLGAAAAAALAVLQTRVLKAETGWYLPCPVQPSGTPLYEGHVTRVPLVPHLCRPP